jgi:cation diffusion facilitator family transporter
VASADVTRAGVRKVLWTTLALNLTVSVGKIVVGRLSGSVSMVADGYHSLVDGSNNVIGLIVAAFAYRPPDRGHPYGHRKFETAASALIGGALLLLAYQVVVGALGHVASDRLPVVGPLNWLVMIATMAMNVFVSTYEGREGRRLGSDYLVADAAHTRSDLYVSMGVVASFAGAKAGMPWADPLVALIIAAVISVQAVRILVGSFDILTDRAVIPVESIAPVVLQVSGVKGCREIRTRGRQDAAFVDLIVHVDGDLPLREAHEVADGIEEALKSRYPQIVDVVVHLEPDATP